MGFSYRRMLFVVLEIVLLSFTIFVGSESGVDCRPLFMHYQWSWEYGHLFQSLPNGGSPGSSGDPTHP
ncbi:hypothetical protein RJT34_18830 [Clitoria ternatea]|uniref:Transmembrane protein n=1 Tax=Clitoria ternatea TaxID=43366 RepID=A0AAN9P3H5_CLITE